MPGMRQAGYAVVMVAAGVLGAGARAAPAPVAQPGYVTGAFVGQPDNAGILPNFNKVSGTSTFNLDIAVPQAVLTHGYQYTYAVSFQDASFTGSCALGYELTQVVAGTKTVLQKGHIATTNCQPGDVFMYYVYGPSLPDSPGPATFTGTVKFGTKTEKLAVPVLLQ